MSKHRFLMHLSLVLCLLILPARAQNNNEDDWKVRAAEIRAKATSLSERVRRQSCSASAVILNRSASRA